MTSAYLTPSSETLTVGYSVVSQPGVTVDLVGGARVADRRICLGDPKIAPSYALGASTRRIPSWVDTIIGVRMRAALSPKWSLIGYGDVGGYDGRTTWQLLGTFNYVSETAFISAGYRQMTLQYEDGETSFDVDLGGSLFGVPLRF